MMVATTDPRWCLGMCYMRGELTTITDTGRDDTNASFRNCWLFDSSIRSSLSLLRHKLPTAARVRIHVTDTAFYNGRLD